MRLVRLGAVCVGLVSAACSDAHGLDESGVAQAATALYGGAETRACERESVVEVGGRCSGVLLHPLLVAYAAHCGERILTVRPAGGGEVAVRRCAAFPGAAVGALDVAYCLLEAPIVTTLTPPATGCELEAVAEGADVTLVGYGPADQGGQFGVRREAAAKVSAVSETRLSVEAEGIGTCLGDSGGPVYVTVNGARRVAGIASASAPGPCEAHVSHFAPLAPALDWMETDSGLDLTPCGSADGVWAPTPACTLGEDVERACGERSKPALADSCGPAFDATSFDTEPPELAFIDAPGISVPPETTRLVEVGLDVSDSGWGIESVELTWAGPDSQVWNGLRSLPPYRFEVPAAGTGRHSFYAIARDHAGNRQTEEWITHVTAGGDTERGSGGCALGPARTHPSAVGSLCASAIAIAARRRRRRG